MQCLYYSILFLFKPELQIGNIAPDPSANHRLFDRIVNVRDSYTVPLGYKGTIIGEFV